MIDPRRRALLRGRIVDVTAPHAPAVQRPPWALHEEAFTARCVRCHACVDACPRHVIRAGDGGFPAMEFFRQGCDFCAGEPACEGACEPQALNRAARQQAWPDWKIAVSDQCLARRQVECRSCGDACDARAIRFKPAPGGIAQMQLDRAACTGCGECVGVCPVGAVRMTHATLKLVSDGE